MKQSILFEICANSVESAIAAAEAGADRVELCTVLPLGGTTPTMGMIQHAVEHAGIPVFVLIRPREGDFCYTQNEFETMQLDILAARQAGAAGIVSGILLPDASIDLPRTRELVRLAHPLPFTFHRAFDMTSDLPAALEDLIRLGIARVLTSGGCASVEEGVEAVARLVQQAAGRVIVMPGGGVNENNLRIILERTGAAEIHFSAAVPRPSSMTYRNPKITLSTAVDDYITTTTCPERVRRLIELARTGRS